MAGLHNNGEHYVVLEHNNTDIEMDNITQSVDYDMKCQPYYRLPHSHSHTTYAPARSCTRKDDATDDAVRALTYVSAALRYLLFSDSIN